MAQCAPRRDGAGTSCAAIKSGGPPARRPYLDTLVITGGFFFAHPRPENGGVKPFFAHCSAGKPVGKLQ